MKRSIFATAVLGAMVVAASAVAQQQQQQAQPPTQVQPGQQQLLQERTVGQGTQLFISPATVRQIQQVLSQAGYDPGNVDGQWGQQTQAAIANFQQANGLEPTGQLNLRTLEALGFGQLAGMGQGGQRQQSQQQGQQQQGQVPTETSPGEQQLEQEQGG